MSTSLELLHRVLILQELIRRDHRDAVPRADLVAQGAADAAREIDRADLERQLVPRAGDDLDAVDGADAHERLAAGAHVLVEQRQGLRKFLLRHRYLILWDQRGLFHQRHCCGATKGRSDQERTKTELVLLHAGTERTRAVPDRSSLRHHPGRREYALARREGWRSC